MAALTCNELIAEVRGLRHEIKAMHADVVKAARIAESNLSPGLLMVGSSGPELAVIGALPKGDPIYSTDDYPRDGCTVVIELISDKYVWRVYQPDIRVVASGMAMESYAPRGIGSLGIALGAFARGAPVRSVMSEMASAEKAYESESGSTVTE